VTQERVASRALAWIDDEMAAIQAGGLERTLLQLSSAPGPLVEHDGRQYLLLGSNNYLDLANHPEVVAAAVAAARRYGAGAGASRLVSGAIDMQARLEDTLASLTGAEGALLFSSGYLANVSTIQALVGRGDQVFSDALNHASIIDGCRLSGAAVTVYPHADLEALGVALSDPGRGRRLVVSDSIFSMDGDSADVAGLVEIAERHDAMLMLDESHALGVLGDGGGGQAVAHGVADRVPVRMGTLSKALGSAGGFIAGPRQLVDWLRHRARGFVFDTAPAPASVGAAIAAVDVASREPERRQRLLALSERLRRGLVAERLTVSPGEAAIVPLLIGDPRRAVEVALEVRKGGVIAPAIRPPSVPVATSRLRLTVSAGFSPDQVDTAVTVIAAAINSIAR
jgi:8-amino-7-oxononanoate synthase